MKVTTVKLADGTYDYRIDGVRGGVSTLTPWGARYQGLRAAALLAEPIKGETKMRRGVSTDQLRKGDIVLNYGMRVVLNKEPHTYESRGEMVYSFEGRVMNVEEVREAGFVPMSFLQTHKWDESARRWTVDREDQWVVQGNRFATWTVEN